VRFPVDSPFQQSNAPSTAHPVRGKEKWLKWIHPLFELCLLAFFPTLIFARGLNARVIEIGVLAWLLSKYLGGKKSPWNLLALTLGGFFAASFLISSLFSVDPIHSTSGLFPFLHGFIFFVIVQYAPMDGQFWKKLGWVILITLGFLGLDVLSQWLWGVGVISGRPGLEIYGVKAYRVFGPFPSSNLLVVLGVFLPAIWLLHRPKSKNPQWITLLLLVLVFASTIGAAVISWSRNVWLTIGLFFILFGWIQFRWVGLGTSVFLIACLLFIFPFGRNVTERFQSEITGDFPRVAIWKFDLLVWEKNPWIGMGPRMFPQVYQNYLDEAKEVDVRHLKDLHHPHSIYLEALVERGIFGLAAFLSLASYGLWKAWRVLNNSEFRRPALFTGAALLLLLICGLFDFSIRYRFYFYSFMFLVGFVSPFRISRFETTKSKIA